MRYPTERGRPRFGQLDPEYSATLQARSDEPGPIFVTILSKFRDGAVRLEAEPAARIDRYNEAIVFDSAATFGEVGAAPVYEALVEEQLEGETIGGGWDRVRIIRFPSRRAVTTFIMSDAFAAALTAAEDAIERAFNIYAVPRTVSRVDQSPALGAERCHSIRIVRWVESAPLATGRTSPVPSLATFDVEGTLVAGRQWDEVHIRPHASPADAARASATERDNATTEVADAYTLVVQPIVNRLVEAI